LRQKAVIKLKRAIMPWAKGDYPESYKNQPVEIRDKAVEIANNLLHEGASEGAAIATGLKKAREFFAKKTKKKQNRVLRPPSKNANE
jgi:uncharacterized protein YdaT